MSSATEQRIKHRLKIIAKESNIPFNSLLDTLFLERFMVRIANSQYADKLIFKGGLCLSQYIRLGRETKDIDFLLIQIKGSIDTIKNMVDEIASLYISDDVTFSNVEVSELSIEHKKYPGYRISLQGMLGQVRNKVSVDIGLGDVVRPRVLEIKLLGSEKPLFEQSIKLSSYPPEYIFSEKTEAILYLGELNSRMKDFYDCCLLIKENILDGNKLHTAINETMDNRGTKLELIPTNTAVFETKWNNFLRKNKITGLNLKDVIVELNQVLQTIIE